jgi:hypothetical protein
MAELKYIDIDRTIYENLRIKTVNAGYLPNIDSFERTQQGKQQWLNALQNVENEKGFIIDIFGVGASIDRGELTTCRMVVMRLEGKNGMLQNSEYENTEGGYRKVKVKYSRHLSYEIRTICRTAEQEQLLNDIVESAFSGVSKYLHVNSGRGLPSTLGFKIFRMNDYNVTVYDHIERRFTYSVKDVFIDSNSENDAIAIVPITSIDFTVNAF